MSGSSDNKEIVIPGWAKSKRTQLAIALAVLFFLGIGVGKTGAGPATPFADLQRPQATVTVQGSVSTVTMTADPASTVTVAGPVRTVTVSTTVTVQPVATTTVSMTPRSTTAVKAPVAAAPKVTPKPSPKPSSLAKPVPLVGSSVYYKNCSAARAAGVTPLHRGDPGYAKHLDRDGDGVACE